MNCISNAFADNLMCLTEGQSLAYQIVSQVGGIGEILAHSLRHLVHINRHRQNHITINSQREFNGVDSVEEAFLILLQVLIIGQRQAFSRCQHSHQMTIHTACLATYQLGNIRVLLLRHHRRAGGKSIVQLHKAEFGAAPEADFLAQTAHMHHEGGSKGKEFNDIVTVAYCVHAVRINCAEVQLLRNHKTVDGERSACNRTGTQRHHVRAFPNAQQAAEVTLQHIEICQHMMRKGNRLRTLQMGITRHQSFFVLFGNC